MCTETVFEVLGDGDGGGCWDGWSAGSSVPAVAVGHLVVLALCGWNGGESAGEERYFARMQGVED